jgi:hypothetical protein
MTRQPGYVLRFFLIFLFSMPYLYLGGRNLTFPAIVARRVDVQHVAKHVFDNCDTVVFVVTFTSLKHATALRCITDACAHTRVVCARHPMLGGVMSDGTLLWTRPLRNNPDVLFSGLAGARVTWEDAAPQPQFDMFHHVTPYTKQLGRAVYTAPAEEIIAHGEEQDMFIVTRVVGFQPCRPCFVQLENAHHTTVLASGHAHVGRYRNGRVQFPLRPLQYFKST